MIKLVVFDWNGTLFSDTSALLVGVNARLSHLGHEPITIKKYREIFEIPAVNAYKKLGLDSKVLDATAKEHAKVFHNAYEARAVAVRTRSGARAVLDYLDKANISKIILSNHNVKAISAQLSRLRLSTSFDTILANDNLWGAHFKGKKDRLVDYLQTVSYRPDEVLIIGDTTEETQIGKELGLHTVAITGGSSTEKRLKDNKPDVLIHKLRDLIDVVGEIK